MNGQASGLSKKEEEVEEAWLSFYEKSSQGAQKEIGLGYYGAAKTRGVLGKCKKEFAGIWTAQGSMLMDTRNEDRHVLSAAYNLEKTGNLGISTW